MTLAGASDILRDHVPRRTDVEAIAQVLRRQPNPLEASAEHSTLDLTFVDLSKTDLRGAHLEGCDLRNSDLALVNLTGAHLEFADLRGAVLDGSFFVAAHLHRARLDGASFRGTLMVGTDLNGAHIEGTDLSNAVGLEYDQILNASRSNRTKLPPDIERVVEILIPASDPSPEL